MKQSSQPGGEAAAPKVDYTDVLDNLDRIYNSIGQAAFAVQGAASTMISCARNLAEEGHRIRALQQALRSGRAHLRGPISCAYCGLTLSCPLEEHICEGPFLPPDYGKSQASRS